MVAESQNIALIPRENKEHLSLPLFCPDFIILKLQIPLVF